MIFPRNDTMKIDLYVDDEFIKGTVEKYVVSTIAQRASEITRNYDRLITERVMFELDNMIVTHIKNTIGEEKLNAAVIAAVEKKMLPVLENKFMGAYIQIAISRARKLAEDSEKIELSKLIKES